MPSASFGAMSLESHASARLVAVPCLGRLHHRDEWGDLAQSAGLTISINAIAGHVGMATYDRPPSQERPGAESRCRGGAMNAQYRPNGPRRKWGAVEKPSLQRSCDAPDEVLASDSGCHDARDGVLARDSVVTTQRYAHLAADPLRRAAEDVGRRM